jgi:hypothetical protein
VAETGSRQKPRDLILFILVSLVGVLFPFFYAGLAGFAFLPYVLFALILGIALMVTVLNIVSLSFARLIIFVAALGGAAVFLRLPGSWPGATATWVLAILAGSFLGAYIKERRRSRTTKS